MDDSLELLTAGQAAAAPADAPTPVAPVAPLELLSLVGTLLEDNASGPTGPEQTVEVLDALVHRAASVIAGAEWASVTVVRTGGHARTLTASHPEALAADEIQYRLKEGPCLDAAREDNVYVTGEVHRDPRWAEYGKRVHRQVGVSSVLASRLTLLGNDSTNAALNIYARSPHAFDDAALRNALVLATQCSLVVSAHLANDRADHLVRALGSNREIGVAIGILMTRHRITQEQAFGLLRLASQDSNRKVADIAADIVTTGELPVLPGRRRRS